MKKKEKIDRLKEEMMKSAEKGCRELRIGEIDFSTTLNNLGETQELWKLVRKAKEGNKINLAWIKIKSRQLDLRKPMFLITEQVSFKCKEARKQYINLKTNAIDMRQAFLSKIADKPRV